MKRPMEDDYESSEEEYPTQIPCKKQATQASQATSQRFRWKAEMIERLLKNLANLKAVYEFKGIDFESDLIKVYGEVRKLMAEEFGAFGPVEEAPIDDGLSTEEMSKARAQNINDKKQIRIGYERVKHGKFLQIGNFFIKRSKFLFKIRIAAETSYCRKTSRFATKRSIKN